MARAEEHVDDLNNPLPAQDTQGQPDAPRRPSVPAPPPGGDTASGAEAFGPPGRRTATVTPEPPRPGPGAPGGAGGQGHTAPLAPRPPVMPLRGAAATAAVIDSARGAKPSVPTDGTWEQSWGQLGGGAGATGGGGAAGGADTFGGAWNKATSPQTDAATPSVVGGPNGKSDGGKGAGNGGKSLQPGQWIVPSTLDSKPGGAGDGTKSGADWKKAEPTGKAEAKSANVSLPFGLDRVLKKLGLPPPTRQGLIRAGAIAVAVLPVLVLLGVWVIRGGSTKSVEAQQAESFQADDTSSMESDGSGSDSNITPDYQGGLGDPTSPRDYYGDPSSGTGSGSGSGSGSYGSSKNGSSTGGGSGGGGYQPSPTPPPGPTPTTQPAPTTPVVNPGEIGLTNKGGNIQWTVLGIPKSSSPTSVTAVTTDRGGGCRAIASYQHTIELCFGPASVTVKSIQKNIAGTNVNFTCSAGGCNGQLMLWKVGLVGAPQISMNGPVTTVVLDMGVTGVSGHWYERLVIVDGNVAEIQHTISFGFAGGNYKDATHFKAG
ncbi:MAG: hypothetical protein IT198_17535 [Acidimicrobiia bacterium]|nr:hypothetical protein [Acidimicrobiia bacterium]